MSDNAQAALGTVAGAILFGLGQIAEWFLKVDGTALITSILGLLTMAAPWIGKYRIKQLEVQSAADENAELKHQHDADEREKQQLRDRLSHVESELAIAKGKNERAIDGEMR